MPSPADSAEFQLSPSEAGAIAGVHPETMKRWAQEGRIRAFRTPGGWWRFNRDDVETFVARGVAEVTPS